MNRCCLRWSTSLLILAIALAARCGREPSSGQAPPAQGGPPAPADADGDGIPDGWETGGVDYRWPGDGSSRRLELKNTGASERHKDIYVWVAWMESNDHTHRPDPSALEIVKESFKKAPVRNPDGFDGINLHVMLAPAPIPETPLLGRILPNNDYDWTEFDQLKTRYFPKELAGPIFFCVFGHQMDAAGHSGITKTLPGRDFIVSLGTTATRVGDTYQQAGTFMHELGHALGLHHGGIDDVNRKPNYLSVMNYFFQMDGLTVGGTQGHYDYSPFILPIEHEGTLNEIASMTPDMRMSKYSSFYSCCRTCGTAAGELRRITSISSGQTDFNCDRRLDRDVSTDVNGDGVVGDLEGPADWSRLSFAAPSNAAGAVAAGAGLRPADELTPALADQIPLAPVTDVHVDSLPAAVVVRWQRIPLDRVLAYRVYRNSGAGDEVIGVVENSVAPEFVDAGPPRGPVVYSVAPAFVPHSGAVNEDPSVRIRTGAVARILPPAEVGFIRRQAPQSMQEWSSTGITANSPRETRPQPRVLLEGERSAAVRIVVK